eukprot:Nitzschia sp. Nitz4//scaffold73_size107353//42715//44187//NITZ4_004315-RA/size107353-processed-gene-0.186-mRNA-1//-1//CDS//3329557461//4401//frame0
MNSCVECCQSSEDNLALVSASSPQHPLLALPRVFLPATKPAPMGDLPVNPYHVLQIRRDAIPAEIRQSYKRLALWNHPGRKPNLKLALAERQRQYSVFSLLAACYQTLIHPDTRRRYDLIGRELEQSKLQAGVRGAMFVGGKRLMDASAPLSTPPTSPARTDKNPPNFWDCTSADSPGRSLLTASSEDHDIPNLSYSSSESDSDDGRSPITHRVASSPKSVGSSRVVTAATVTSGSRTVTPSLVNGISSGSEEEEAETHYSEPTTHRLFGGRLAHIYRARDFEPFNDPFDVFADVFGSRIFEPADKACLLGPMDPTNRPALPSLGATTSRAAGWHGTSETTVDGKTTVFTTSRVLNERILTRRETVTRVAPGKTQTHVSVTTEALNNAKAADDEPHKDLCLMLCLAPPTEPEDSTPNDTSSFFCIDKTLCQVSMDEIVELDVLEGWFNEMLTFPSQLFPPTVTTTTTPAAVTAEPDKEPQQQQQQPPLLP